MGKFHDLKIAGNIIELDGFRLKGVHAFDLKVEPKQISTLTVTIYVERDINLKPKLACKNISCDLREDI